MAYPDATRQGITRAFVNVIRRGEKPRLKAVQNEVRRLEERGQLPPGFEWPDGDNTWYRTFQDMPGRRRQAAEVESATDYWTVLNAPADEAAAVIAVLSVVPAARSVVLRVDEGRWIFKLKQILPDLNDGIVFDFARYCARRERIDRSDPGRFDGRDLNLFIAMKAWRNWDHLYGRWEEAVKALGIRYDDHLEFMGMWMMHSEDIGDPLEPLAGC